MARPRSMREAALHSAPLKIRARTIFMRDLGPFGQPVVARGGGRNKTGTQLEFSTDTPSGESELGLG